MAGGLTSSATRAKDELPQGVSGITFGRTTRIVFDTGDEAVSEPMWSGGRAKGDLNRKPDPMSAVASKIPSLPAGITTPLLTDFDSKCFHQWRSGAITLRPLQMEMSWFQESGLYSQAGLTDYILDHSQWNMPTYPGVSSTTVPMFTEFYASGRPARPGLPAAAPKFPLMRKDYPAGGDRTNALSSPYLTPVIKPIGPYTPIGSADPIPGMYRVLETKPTLRADQGFMFFFDLHTAQHDNPFQLFTFLFGQYALAIMGNGTALLYETAVSLPGLTDWNLVKQFEWSQQKNVSDHAHHIIVWPSQHILHFLCDSADASGWIGFAPKGESDTSESSQPYEHLYKQTGVMAANSFTTCPNPVRVDICASVRCNFHCSKLAYPIQANYIEASHAIPMAQNTVQKLTVGRIALVPTNTNLYARLAFVVPDATTGKPTLNLQTPDPTTQTFALPGNANMFYPVWTFQSLDGKDTPVLYSTSYDKPPVVTATAGTNKTTHDAAITQVTISGPGKDPSHETATVEIKDYTNSVGPYVVGHDMVPFAIVLDLQQASLGTGAHILPATQNLPPSGVTKCILHAGYTRKARGIIRPGNAFSNNLPWYDLSVSGVGVYERMNEYVSVRHKGYGADKDDVSKPWKATDVIKDLFLEMGVGPDRLDCPDLPIRLWGGSATGEIYELAPNERLMAKILVIVRDYLGGWMQFEPNLGPYGIWRVLFPPPTGTTAICNVNLPEGALIFANRPENYTAGTTFWEECEFRTDAPEATAVCLWGDTLGLDPGSGNTVKTQWMVNPNGFNGGPFSTAATPNRDSPDWRGAFVPVYIPDPTLVDQASLDWMTRRYYDRIARGSQWLLGSAPLMLVADTYSGSIAALEGTQFVRTLQHYDIVNVNSIPCYVDSCTIDYKSDWNQRMHLELQVIFNDCTARTRTNPFRAMLGN